MQKAEVKEILEEVLNEMLKKVSVKEWMSLKEGAEYANVCYNTFIKFRNKGLKISEIDSIKRVSKTEIDNFLRDYSY